MTEKTNYRCVPSLQQFYSGGAVTLSSDGTFLACACNEKITIVKFIDASIKATLEGDSELVTSLAISPDDRFLFSASHSRLIRVWDLESFKCIRSWKVRIDEIFSFFLFTSIDHRCIVDFFFKFHSLGPRRSSDGNGVPFVWGFACYWRCR